MAIFSGWTIAAAFILMFVPIYFFDSLEKKRRYALLRIMAIIGILAAVYCISSGFFLMTEWVDPLVDVGQDKLIKTIHSWRDGVVILSIKFWPFVLIGLGGFWVYVYTTVRRSWKSR